MEHVRHASGFSLSALSFLVVDEADRLLSQPYQVSSFYYSWYKSTCLSIIPGKNWTVSPLFLVQSVGGVGFSLSALAFLVVDEAFRLLSYPYQVLYPPNRPVFV